MTDEAVRQVIEFSLLIDPPPSFLSPGCILMKIVVHLLNYEYRR